MASHPCHREPSSGCGCRTLYRARQLLEYALQELDAEGTTPAAVTRAWDRLRELGSSTAPVPQAMTDDVQAMHAQVAQWQLPRHRDALETTVAWMDGDELRRVVQNIQRWAQEVDAVISAERT